jgi:hypothetical protein
VTTFRQSDEVDVQNMVMEETQLKEDVIHDNLRPPDPEPSMYTKGRKKATKKYDLSLLLQCTPALIHYVQEDQADGRS